MDEVRVTSVAKSVYAGIAVAVLLGLLAAYGVGVVIYLIIRGATVNT